MGSPLDIQDYLDATSDAAKRTRTVIITLVVASALVFAGLLNSLQSHWMLQRLHALGEPHSEYLESKIGPIPMLVLPDPLGLAHAKERYQGQLDLYRSRYDAFYSAAARAYIDNALSVKVPFFGFTFDVNDLGLLGGIAFICILVMFRFCLTREVDNLRTSFKEAKNLKQLAEFYTLLSMRQVFTVPENLGINRGRFLVLIPKLICFFPLIVHTAVVLHDYQTASVGKQMDELHTQISLACNGALLIVIAILTWMVTTRMLRIDEVWEEYWIEVHPQTPTKVTTQESPTGEAPEPLARGTQQPL